MFWILNIRAFGFFERKDARVL